MYNLILINELKGKILAKGYTQKKIAEEIGITPKTFSEKLKRGIFGSDEIEVMIEKLELKNPMEIFFANVVTCEVTNENKRRN